MIRTPCSETCNAQSCQSMDSLMIAPLRSPWPVRPVMGACPVINDSLARHAWRVSDDWVTAVVDGPAWPMNSLSSLFFFSKNYSLAEKNNCCGSMWSWLRRDDNDNDMSVDSLVFDKYLSVYRNFSVTLTLASIWCWFQLTHLFSSRKLLLLFT